MIGSAAPACFRAVGSADTRLLPRNTNTAHPASGSAAPACFRAKQYVPPDHKSESGGTSFV